MAIEAISRKEKNHLHGAVGWLIPWETGIQENHTLFNKHESDFDSQTATTRSPSYTEETEHLQRNLLQLYALLLPLLRKEHGPSLLQCAKFTSDVVPSGINLAQSVALRFLCQTLRHRSLLLLQRLNLCVHLAQRRLHLQRHAHNSTINYPNLAEMSVQSKATYLLLRLELQVSLLLYHLVK
ncbi:hypothetical protein GQ600_11887 [Phytophthora cactorum]|nr:hypothetical protein GQ600_11887 [Phytophthora cactorum]